jgi:hypothetical protein
VDDKEMLLMVMDDKEVHPSYDVGVWVTTPYFAKAMNDIFGMTWGNLKPAK